MIAAAGAEGKVGGKGKVDVEDQTIVSEKDSTYVNPIVQSPDNTSGQIDTAEIVRMNRELETATGSYKKYLEDKLGNNIGYVAPKATTSEQADKAIEDLKSQGVKLEETGFATWEKLKESLLEEKVEAEASGLGRRDRYNPNSMQVSSNRTSMKIAIEEGDAVKVQAILDNLERMLDENPSYDTKMKIGYMRGDGLRALKELVKGK
jgi:hypothetical protein